MNFKERQCVSYVNNAAAISRNSLNIKVVLYLLFHHNTTEEQCVVNQTFFLFFSLGVEDAFSFTSKVMSVSFHKFSPGFFPGNC